MAVTDTNQDDQRELQADVHRLEQELNLAREKAELLRAVLETTVDGVITIDERGEVTSFNHAAELIFGYHAYEVMGKNISFLMPEPDRALHDAYIGNYERTRQPKIIGIGRQVVGLRKDNSFVPLDLSISEAWSGGKKWYTGIVRDLTQRVQGEQNLAASEAQSQLIFETAPFGMALVGLDHIMKQVNPTLAHMLGRSIQEVVGHRVGEFFPPEMHANQEGVHERFLAEGDDYDQRERTMVHADGRSLTVRVTNSVIRGPSGEIVSFVRIFEDITDQRLGEAALQQTQERFSVLVESAPVGIAMLDKRRAIIEANPALVRMFGGDRSAIIGSDMTSFALPSTYNRHGKGTWEALLTRHVTPPPREIQLQDHLSDVKWVEVVTAPVFDASGDLEHAIRVFSDITEHKQIADAKDEFIAMTSHELRTPLTAIHAAVGLAGSGALGEVPRAIQRQLEIASANSDRLIDLVNDVLTLEQLGLGKMEMRLQPVNVASLLNRAKELTEPLALAKSINIEVASELDEVQCDEARVLQVLTNLISNAVKFSPRQSTVTVTGEARDGDLLISVADAGPGIPFGAAEKVFVEFQQIARPGQSVQQGTGLGLSIAKAIVVRHGGFIWVDTNANGGATFRFTLPVDEQQRTRTPIADQ